MVFVVVFFLAAALLVLVVRLLFPLATSVVARLVERRFGPTTVSGTFSSFSTTATAALVRVVLGVFP